MLHYRLHLLQDFLHNLYLYLLILDIIALYKDAGYKLPLNIEFIKFLLNTGETFFAVEVLDNVSFKMIHKGIGFVFPTMFKLL